MVRAVLWPCAGRRSSVVERALGKGEVECSIHSGGTIKLSVYLLFLVDFPLMGLQQSSAFSSRTNQVFS